MEPPDPMFDKDTPQWDVIKWWAVVIPIAIWWVISIPLRYPFRYIKGLRSRRSLSYDEVVTAVEGQNNRYVTQPVLGFLKAEGYSQHQRFTWMVLPGWHPASSRVIVKTKYHGVEVVGRW